MPQTSSNKVPQTLPSNKAKDRVACSKCVKLSRFGRKMVQKISSTIMGIYTYGDSKMIQWILQFNWMNHGHLHDAEDWFLEWKLKKIVLNYSIYTSICVQTKNPSIHHRSRCCWSGVLPIVSPNYNFCCFKVFWGYFTFTTRGAPCFSPDPELIWGLGCGKLLAFGV